MTKATPAGLAVKAGRTTATVTQLPRAKPLEEAELPDHWAKPERSHYLWTMHYHPDRHAETYAYCEAMAEVGPRQEGEKEIDYMLRRAKAELSVADEHYGRGHRPRLADAPGKSGGVAKVIRLTDHLRHRVRGAGRSPRIEQVVNPLLLDGVGGHGGIVAPACAGRSGVPNWDSRLAQTAEEGGPAPPLSK